VLKALDLLPFIKPTGLFSGCCRLRPITQFGELAEPWG
jgi:hypothetical protein